MHIWSHKVERQNCRWWLNLLHIHTFFNTLEIFINTKLVWLLQCDSKMNIIRNPKNLSDSLIQHNFFLLTPKVLVKEKRSLILCTQFWNIIPVAWFFTALFHLTPHKPQDKTRLQLAFSPKRFWQDQVSLTITKSRCKFFPPFYMARGAWTSGVVFKYNPHQ